MFLNQPEHTEGADRLYDDDRKYMGFVMNGSRLWSWQPESNEKLFEFMGMASAGMTMRQRGILVAACASSLGDSYCSIAWGGKLAKSSDAATAAGVIEGTDENLDEAEREMARWARLVTRDPNGTTQDDVDRLRAVGFTDGEIFGMTAFVAARIAFSHVNDALGATPDPELRDFSPPEVIDAVTFGRPIAG